MVDLRLSNLSRCTVAGIPDCVGLVVDLYLGTSSPRSQYHFQRFSIPSGVDISGMIGFLCNVIVSSTVKFASFTNFMVLDDRTFLRALAMEATTKQLVNKIGPVFAHFSRENDTFSADVLKKLFKWMTDGEHDSDQMRPYLRLLNYLCKLDDSLQQARQENIMRNMLYSFRDCCDDAHLWKKADMLLDFIIRFSTSFESCKQYCFNQEGDVALLIDMAIEWLEEYAKKTQEEFERDLVIIHEKFGTRRVSEGKYPRIHHLDENAYTSTSDFFPHRLTFQQKLDYFQRFGEVGDMKCSSDSEPETLDRKISIGDQFDALSITNWGRHWLSASAKEVSGDSVLVHWKEFERYQGNFDEWLPRTSNRIVFPVHSSFNLRTLRVLKVLHNRR
jgi:hypothetical protein